VVPSFEPVRRRFDEFLAEDPSFSAQLSIRVHGEIVLDLAGGDLQHDSITGVWSVSKALSAFVVARAIDEGSLRLDARVAEVWPEFGQAGKEEVTVRQLLSHQAGLPALLGTFTHEEAFVHPEAGAARLAAQAPLWRPGTAFGYHAFTIGTLAEELVRRALGRRLQDVYEHDIRAPRDADAYLGLPESEDARYVLIEEAVLTSEQQAELAARPPADDLLTRVFANMDAASGTALHGMTPNNPVARRAGQAATGAVASAHGLARVFADALPTSEAPIASAETLSAMAQQQSWGIDRVFGAMNGFGILFLVPQTRLPYASVGSVGHDGAGGALAFADPMNGISFGYVPHPMQHPGGADHRSVILARLAAQCVNPSQGGPA
jgi:CubicO group peptidase (beta-lactamase class C family)